MSAYKDIKAPVQFYFGNAAVDLDHMLPPEDEATVIASSSLPLSEQLEAVEMLVEQVDTTQKRLSFLLRDLNRIFK